MDPRLKKLASEMPTVLRAAGQTVREMTTKVAELSEERDELHRENQAMKLARRLEQRGLATELDFEGKVAHILSLDQTKIAAFEQAIEMAHSGFSLGAAATEDKVAGGSSDGDVLSNFIMSQQAYGN